MSRRFPSVVLLLFAVLLVCAAGASAAQPQTLRMGILPVLDTLPLQVGVQSGSFAAQGLNVELVPFASALERDTAMRAGQLDGYFGDMIATLMLIQSGVPLRIVTVSYATTPGQPMFAVLAAPGKPATWEGLAGQTVSISRSTIIEYLYDAMAAQAGVAPGSLEVVEIQKIPIRMQMLLSGEIAAALLPEPLVTLAASKGAQIVATDEQLGQPLTVLCLSEEALAGGKDVAGRFQAGYDQAVAELNAHPEEYRGLMAETCRIPPPLAKDFPIYRFPGPQLPSRAAVQQVEEWMLGHGLLNAPLDYARVVALPTTHTVQ